MGLPSPVVKHAEKVTASLEGSQVCFSTDPTPSEIPVSLGVCKEGTRGMESCPLEQPPTYRLWKITVGDFKNRTNVPMK